MGQLSFLRLATTEVLSPKSQGYMSGNVAIVRRAAEACLHQSLDAIGTMSSSSDLRCSNYFSYRPSLSSEAARTLLMINSMLHPSTLPLVNAQSQCNAAREG